MIHYVCVDTVQSEFPLRYTGDSLSYHLSVTILRFNVLVLVLAQVDAIVRTDHDWARGAD